MVNNNVEDIVVFLKILMIYICCGKAQVALKEKATTN